MQQDYSNMSVYELFELYRQNFGEPNEKASSVVKGSSPGTEERAAMYASKADEKPNNVDTGNLSPLAKSLGMSEKQLQRVKDKKAYREKWEAENQRSFPAPATLQSAFGFGGNQTTGVLTGTPGDTVISDPVFGFNPETNRFEILENK